MRTSLRDFLLKFKELGGDLSMLKYVVEGYSVRRIVDAKSDYLQVMRENSSTFYANDKFYSRQRTIQVEPLQAQYFKGTTGVTLLLSEN